MNIEIREYRQSDKNFIYSCWLRGIYFGNPSFSQIDKNILFKVYQEVVSEILSRPQVKTMVACLPEEKDVVIGYIVKENDICHWIFVKESFRKMGIANMLSKDIKKYSHFTRIGKTIITKRNLEFKPFWNKEFYT